MKIDVFSYVLDFFKANHHFINIGLFFETFKEINLQRVAHQKLEGSQIFILNFDAILINEQYALYKDHIYQTILSFFKNRLTPWTNHFKASLIFKCHSKIKDYFALHMGTVAAQLSKEERKQIIFELITKFEKKDQRRLSSVVKDLLKQVTILKKDAYIDITESMFNKNIEDMNVYRYYYQQFYHEILKEITTKIRNKEMKFNHLFNMVEISNEERVRNQIQGIWQLTSDLYHEAQDFKDKFRRLYQILVEYEQTLPQQTDEVGKILQSFKVLDVYQWRNQKYQPFAQDSEQLMGECNMKIWERNNISKLSDFLTQKSRVQNLIRIKINDVLNKKLSFLQFSTIFTVENLKTILPFCDTPDKKNMIPKLTQKMNIKRLVFVYNILRGVKCYLSKFNVQTVKYKWGEGQNILKACLSTLQILKLEEEESMMDEKQNSKRIEVKAIELFKILTSIQDEMKKLLNLDFEDKKDQLIKILGLFAKCENIFKVIDLHAIDKDVVNDLKDYINDIENCILKLEHVRALEDIVLYKEIVDKAPSFVDYTKKVRGEIQLRGWMIPKAIQQIHSNLSLIEQKIDQSKNRETSFKYQIEEILKNSSFIVENTNEKLKIFLKVEGSLKADLKKLQNFKDKSLLLVTDFERQNVDEDDKTFQIIKLLRDFLKLFECIDKIKVATQSLLKFGYSIKELEQNIRIKDGNYQQIEQLAIDLKDSETNWTSLVKDYYKKSYVMTHFVGKRLCEFLDQSFNGIYNNQLLRLFSIEPSYFHQSYRELQNSFRIDRNSRVSPEDKLEFVYQLFDDIYDPLENINLIRTKSMEGYNIELITCHQSYFYYNTIEDNVFPPINRVLYCQKQTTVEEVQCFFRRAMIRPCGNYYIIAVNTLAIEKQQEFCDIINECLRDDKEKFREARFCFIDNSKTEKVYLHLCQKELFSVKKSNPVFTDIDGKLKKKFLALLENVYFFTSTKAGLGKTFEAEQTAAKISKTKKVEAKLHYFPVAGNIDFERISLRLQNLNMKENDSLLLQIGHVQNKQKVETLIVELIMFRCFHYEGYFFLPKHTNILIELENTIDANLFKKEQKNKEGVKIPDAYHILKVLKDDPDQYTELTEFKIEKLLVDPSNDKESFVFIFLDYLQKEKLKRTDFQHLSWEAFSKMSEENKKEKIISSDRCKELTFIYYLSQENKINYSLTFRHFKYFMTLLFEVLMTLSEAYTFAPQFLKEQHKINRHLGFDRMRDDLLRIFIRNSFEFLIETINTNQFEDNDGREDLRDKLRDFPFLITSNQDRMRYHFIYLDEGKVDVSIKTLKVSQDTNKNIQYMFQRMRDTRELDEIFKKRSLNSLKDFELEAEFLYLLSQLSSNNKLYLNENHSKENVDKFHRDYPQFSKYRLTLDNFLKMALVIQRMKCKLPTIIMGQSGVGKTALIHFLVKVVFEHTLVTLNVHAGINEARLIQFKNQIMEVAQENRNSKVWVFFDEFNTTDEISYIKEMVIDRRFQGEVFPDNVIFLAACNPYRELKASKTKSAGIKKKIPANVQNLAFKVKPPPLTMINVMWDYQQLEKEENKLYISKILDVISYQKHDDFVEAVSEVHEFIKKNKEISSVSLRDVSRLKQICIWFEKISLKEEMNQIDHLVENEKEKAVILGITFCYGVGLSENQARGAIFQIVQKCLKLKDGVMLEILQYQQRRYCSHFSIPSERIAVNRALRENIFVILICVMNKIPVLVVGNPGNSKSLSVRMLNSNLRGKNSDVKFCQMFPQLNLIYFQGSQACTSRGVEQLFERVKESNRQFQEAQEKRHQKLKEKNKNLINYLQVENCIYFDEIGLAEKSIHNPLKVLHSELETDQKEIGFIGVSNWELDASKMSRFLKLARSTPELNELKDTAVSILKTYINKPSPFLIKKFEKMAYFYETFLNKWDSNQNNIEGFFGLRDFYSYIKFVCERLITMPESQTRIDQIIFQSVVINFDGQPNSLKTFYSDPEFEKFESARLNPIELVCTNLENPQSRCLLLILRGDALVPLLNEKITVNGKERNAICMYGSTFEEDQASEEYNLEVTSRVIAHISRGNILSFKDINSSIQTSLYDLFNKSFYQAGGKKYCRIAVGAYSNPKCLVHEDFNAIVYIDETNIPKTDLAFLNRFEKHYMNLSSMISETEYSILEEIQGWLHRLLQNVTSNTKLKRQNFIINCCEESLVTLIIKHRKNAEKTQQRIKAIKYDLLMNKTLDFELALQLNKVPKDLVDEVKNICDEGVRIKSDDRKIQKIQKMKEDIIIYTYDQNLDSLTNHKFSNDQTFKFRLSSVKGERELRREIQSGLKSNRYNSVEILVNYERELQHVNLLLHLCTEIKQSLNKPNKESKKVIIIIQLCRFSLINLKSEAINISYLHNFTQCFIEDLSHDNRTRNVLQCKTMNKILNHFDINNEQEFKVIFLQALQEIDFTRNPNLFPLTQALIFNNKFKEYCWSYIRKEAEAKHVDFTYLLEMKDDANFCINVQEAIRDHAFKFYREILVAILLTLIDVGLIFPLFLCNTVECESRSFNKNSFVMGQEIKQMLQLFEEFPQNFKPYIQIVEACLKIIDFKNKKVKIGIESNKVELDIISIIPMFNEEIKFLSIKGRLGSEKSVQNTCVQLFLRSQAHPNERDELFRNSFSICNRNFVQNSIMEMEIMKQLIKNEIFDLFYLFDCSRLIYGYGDQAPFCTPKQLNRLVKFFNILLNSQGIQIKVMFLLQNKKITTSLYDYLLTISTTSEELIEKFKEFRFSDYNFNIYDRILDFTFYLILIHQKDSAITEQNVRKYGDSTNYLSFFDDTYLKIMKLRTIVEENDRTVPNELKITKELIDVFKCLSTTPYQISLLIKDFLLQKPNRSLEFRIHIFLIDILKKVKNSNEQEVIETYLMLNVYPKWLDRQLKDQNRGQVESEFQVLLVDFIHLSNQYSTIANKNSLMVQRFLSDFSFNNFADKWKYAQNPPIYFDSLLQNVNTNITIAIGNGINSKLKEEMFQAIEHGNTNEHILNQYFTKFKEVVGIRPKNKFQQLMVMEFCKIYLTSYANELINKKNTQKMRDVDSILCIKTEMTDHFRLYILKHLIKSQKGSVQKVRKNFLDVNVCKWLQLNQSFIQFENVQMLEPPIYNYSHNLSDLIEKYQKEEYKDFDLFRQIYIESNLNSTNKYQFLSFALTDFYTRMCSDEDLMEIQRQLLSIPAFNEEKRWLEKKLIMGYIHHKVNNEFMYSKDQKSRNFIEDQLLPLSIINLFVAFMLEKSPLFDMFFDEAGKIPQDYAKWVQNRFLICGRQNLSVQTLIYGLNGDAHFTLHRCSRDCDYLYDIGNCHRPYQQGTCPWCKLTIGGLNHQYTRKKDGARCVPKQDMPAELKTLRAKKILKMGNKEVKLCGYTMGSTVQKIKQFLSVFNRTKLVTNRLLTYFIQIMWRYIFSLDEFNHQESVAIFGCDTNTINQVFKQSCEGIFEEIMKNMNLEEETTKIWIMGMSSKIFNTVIPKGMAFKSSLTDAENRDHFEEEVEKVIGKHTGGHEKETLIKQSRKTRQSAVNHHLGLMQETLRFDYFVNKFRMIRVLKFTVEPSFNNFYQDYQESIKLTHPALSYLVEHVQQFEQANKSQILFMFIGRLIKLLNYRISKTDAENKGFNQILQQSEQSLSKVEIIELKKMFKKFSSRWNELTNMELEDRCNQLGKLEYLKDDNFAGSYPVINFLPDRNNAENLGGFKALSLLRMEAAKYNQLCFKLQQEIIKINQFKDTEIILLESQSPIRPTNFLKEKLANFSREMLETQIKTYSTMSVDYGVANPVYYLTKIEAILVQNFKGKKLIIEDREKCDIINFYAGELNIMIMNMQALMPQKKLEGHQVKSIENQLSREEKNDPEKYHKYIKDLLLQIEFLMYYSKNLKAQGHTPINQFVGITGITINVGYLNKEPFRSFPLELIVDIYETVEINTFKHADRRLDKKYQEHELEENEVNKIKRILDKLDKERVNEIKTAVYRLVVRDLFPMKITPMSFLHQWLGGAEQYWINVDPFFSMEIPDAWQEIESAFELTLSKTGSLLKLIPFFEFEKQKKINQPVVKQPEKIKRLKRKENRE